MRHLIGICWLKSIHLFCRFQKTAGCARTHVHTYPLQYGTRLRKVEY